jgi:hypothetical protein
MMQSRPRERLSPGSLLHPYRFDLLAAMVSGIAIALVAVVTATVLNTAAGVGCAFLLLVLVCVGLIVYVDRGIDMSDARDAARHAAWLSAANRTEGLHNGASVGPLIALIISRPLTAADVLASVGPDLKTPSGRTGPPGFLVVAPLAFTGPKAAGSDDDHEWATAEMNENATVRALTAEGFRASGHVGDRDIEQAIASALTLFAADAVIIFVSPASHPEGQRRIDDDALSHGFRRQIRSVELSDA